MTSDERDFPALVRSAENVFLFFLNPEGCNGTVSGGRTSTDRPLCRTACGS